MLHQNISYRKTRIANSSTMIAPLFIKTLSVIALSTLLCSCALQSNGSNGFKAVVDFGEFMTTTVDRFNLGDISAEIRRYGRSSHYEMKFFDLLNVIDLGENIYNVKLQNSAVHPNHEIVVLMFSTPQCKNSIRIIQREKFNAMIWDFNQTQINCANEVQTEIDPDRIIVRQVNAGVPARWFVNLNGDGKVTRDMPRRASGNNTSNSGVDLLMDALEAQRLH